jgi:hypothetical protein
MPLLLVFLVQASYLKEMMRVVFENEKLNPAILQALFSKSHSSVSGKTPVPGILRAAAKMFVSVRIVEQKLLNKYPNSYPDDLGKHQPLTSFFITPHECKLLNEINQVHCGGEFGTKLFAIKHLKNQFDFRRLYPPVLTFVRYWASS